MSLNTRKEKTSHERMSCPFCISYDFDEVSRIVDIEGVTEIVLEGIYAKRLHFASEMDILKIKELPV